MLCFYFFFNDTATTEIYTYGHTLSLHDALPIYGPSPPIPCARSPGCRERRYRPRHARRSSAARRRRAPSPPAGRSLREPPRRSAFRLLSASRRTWHLLLSRPPRRRSPRHISPDPPPAARALWRSSSQHPNPETTP